MNNSVIYSIKIIQYVLNLFKIKYNLTGILFAIVINE